MADTQELTQVWLQLRENYHFPVEINIHDKNVFDLCTAIFKAYAPSLDGAATALDLLLYANDNDSDPIDPGMLVTDLLNPPYSRGSSSNPIILKVVRKYRQHCQLFDDQLLALRLFSTSSTYISGPGQESSPALRWLTSLFSSSSPASSQKPSPLLLPSPASSSPSLCTLPTGLRRRK